MCNKRVIDMIWITIVLFISLNVVQTITGIKDDYCENDNFQATCVSNEVILMQNATYGRMKTGKCIDRRFEMGCSKNVLSHLDRLCSGHRSCKFNVFAELDHIQPCGKGLKSYLEAIYTCLRVDNLGPKACTKETPIIAQEPLFHLSKDADEAHCRDRLPTWNIKTSPGAVIEVKLMDFTQTPQSPTSCAMLGHIVESVVRTNRTICGSVGNREALVYTSLGHELDITLLPEAVRGSPGIFGLQYKAKGCKEVSLPSNVFYKRDGNIAEIGCSVDDTRWRLECVDRNWKGEMGNCTYGGGNEDSSSSFGSFLSTMREMPESITIAIVIGVAVLLSIFVLACGFIYIAKHRQNKDYISETYSHGPRRTESEFKMYGPEERPGETVKRTPLMYNNTTDRRDMYPTMIDKRDMYPTDSVEPEVCSCASYSSIPRLVDKQGIKDDEMYLDPRNDETLP